MHKKRTFPEFAFHLIPCSVMTCPVVLIKKDIDHFYYDIVNTVYGCIRKCIPMKKHNEHSIVASCRLE